MDSAAPIAKSFSRAAHTYNGSAGVQALVARLLHERVRQHRASPPRRILEIGCGTGLFTIYLCEMFPGSEIIATDISAEMVAVARRRLEHEHQRLSFCVTDGESPSVQGPFDLICCSLAFQWFRKPQSVLKTWGGLLAPRGSIFVSTLCHGTFHEWRQACHKAQVQISLRDFPTLAQLETFWPPGGSGRWTEQYVVDRVSDGLGFLRSLRAIGADVPPEGHKPHSAGALKKVLGHFDRESAGGMTYRVGMGAFHSFARPGVFVMGTDTGVGKTFVAACLSHAWQAVYWKPVQTGADDGDNDTKAAEELLQRPRGFFPAPALTFGAPLAPKEAAAREGKNILPVEIYDYYDGLKGDMLVVEGAGGALVPIADALTMCELAQGLSLPVIIVARAGLGTINHTGLTAEALRRRGLCVLGVILNGRALAGNKEAVEAQTGLPVLAEIPWINNPSPQAVKECAALIPPWERVINKGGCG